MVRSGVWLSGFAPIYLNNARHALDRLHADVSQAGLIVGESGAHCHLEAKNARLRMSLDK